MLTSPANVINDHESATDSAGSPLPRRRRGRLAAAVRVDLAQGIQAVVLIGLIVVPLIFVFAKAFSGGAGASANGFADLLSSPGFGRSLWMTLSAAAIGTVAALVLGLGLALITERLDIRLARLFKVVIFIPLLISPLGAALSWAVLGSPQTGLLWKALAGVGIHGDLYSYWGIVFVLVLSYVPYTYVVLSTALNGIDSSLEEAAATFGAGGWARLRWVVFPLLRIPLLSAGLITFGLIAEAFAPPTILGTPGNVTFLSTLAYQSVVEFPVDYTRAASIAIILMGVVLLCYGFQSALSRRHLGQATIHGKGFHPAPKIRAGVGGWAMVGLAALYIILSGVLPILTLVWAAMRTSPFVQSLSDIFDTSKLSFQPVLDSASTWLPLMWNTILIGLAAGVVGAVVAFLAVCTANRRNAGPLARYLIEGPIVLSLGVPGLVFGMAYLFAGVHTPIYGSLALMVLAYCSKNIAQAHQSLVGRYHQISEELEESAAIFGAGRGRRLLRIVLPIMWPNLIYAALFVFIFTVRELTPVLFIYTPTNSVLAVQSLESWFNGDLNGAATITLVQSMLMFAALCLAQLAVRWSARSGRPSRSAARPAHQLTETITKADAIALPASAASPVASTQQTSPPNKATKEYECNDAIPSLDL